MCVFNIIISYEGFWEGGPNMIINDITFTACKKYDRGDYEHWLELSTQQSLPLENGKDKSKHDRKKIYTHQFG